MNPRLTTSFLSSIAVVLTVGMCCAEGLPTGQQGSSQASLTITLSPAKPSSANHSARIVAPGRNAHNYNLIPIDTTAFKAGGILDIDIQVLRSSHTDASFDLFLQGAALPKAGSTRPSVQGRYDVRRGTSTRLEYRFSAGQVFGLGLEGNWFNPKGATGDVQVSANVRANAAPASSKSAKSDLKVLPIVYGPTVQPGGQNLGLCIYLGGRRVAGSESKADYNWVQRVKASDHSSSDCPVGSDTSFVDNCPGSPSYKRGSDFYRNGDAKYYAGQAINTWIDPEDQKPFDYLFLDISGRPTKDLSGEMTWSAVLNSVRSDEGGLSACPAGQRGPSSGSAAGYCKGTTITYGYSLHKLSGLGTAISPRYRMDLDPLVIDGVQVADRTSYGVSELGHSFAFYRLDLLTGLPLTGLPMTFSNLSEAENVCQYDYVKKGRTDHGTGAPPEEPAKFQKPFPQN